MAPGNSGKKSGSLISFFRSAFGTKKKDSEILSPVSSSHIRSDPIPRKLRKQPSLRTTGSMSYRVSVEHPYFSFGNAVTDGDADEYSCIGFGASGSFSYDRVGLRNMSFARNAVPPPSSPSVAQGESRLHDDNEKSDGEVCEAIPLSVPSVVKITNVLSWLEEQSVEKIEVGNKAT